VVPTQTPTDQRHGSPGAAIGTNADVQESEARKTRAHGKTAADANPRKRQRVDNEVENLHSKRRSDRQSKPTKRALGG
jgi:hypothetical protein